MSPTVAPSATSTSSAPLPARSRSAANNLTRTFIARSVAAGCLDAPDMLGPAHVRDADGLEPQRASVRGAANACPDAAGGRRREAEPPRPRDRARRVP